jgi:hypothetical protein
VLGNDYHVYRILDIISKREYMNLGQRYYKKHNIRHSLNHDGRGKKCGYLEYGCAGSASAIKQVIGAKSAEKIHNDIMDMKELRLVDVTLFNDEKPSDRDNQYWYLHIDITDLGIHYLQIYEKMLELVNYFDTMKVMI